MRIMSRTAPSLWAAFLALTLASFWASCDLLELSESSPHLNGIPGKIVYSAEIATGENGNTLSQIFVIGQNGTRQLTVAEEPYHFAQEPAWSPDGEQIVFTTGRRALMGLPSLYLMDADGSNMRPLKKYPGSKFTLSGEHPAWSPDGQKIAYDRCLNCEAGGKNRDIFVFDRVADTTRQLTHHLLGDRFPTWSPDGKQIAFVSGRDHPGEPDTDLYVMNADGSNQRRLTETGDVGELLWGPGEHTIVYGSGGPNSRLFMIDVENQKVSPLETDLPSRMNDLLPMAWSQKATKLLLTAQYYPNYSLYLLDIETGKAEQLSLEQEGALDASVDWFVRP